MARDTENLMTIMGEWRALASPPGTAGIEPASEMEMSVLEDLCGEATTYAASARDGTVSSQRVKTEKNQSAISTPSQTPRTE